jgi:hypothetical protein
MLDPRPWRLATRSDGQAFVVVVMIVTSAPRCRPIVKLPEVIKILLFMNYNHYYEYNP